MPVAPGRPRSSARTRRAGTRVCGIRLGGLLRVRAPRTAGPQPRDVLRRAAPCVLPGLGPGPGSAERWARGRVIVVAIALLASGCATVRYTEPALPDDQVATLETESGVVILRAIDGAGVGRTEPRSRVRVAPGERTVVVGYLPPAGYADSVTVVFTARPGQAYRIRGAVTFIPLGKWLSGSWRASVVDAATGEVVASRSGSIVVTY